VMISIALAACRGVCFHDSEHSRQRANDMNRSQTWIAAACWLIMVVTVLVTAGCRTQPEIHYPVRWARAWIDSLNSRRLQEIVPLLAPGATYEDPMSGGARSGPSLGFLLFRNVRRYPHAHYELERVTADKDRLAVEWKATGLSKSTNRPPLSGVFVIQLQGDAIASVRGYFDASGLR
jgi:hypothetical protein